MHAFTRCRCDHERQAECSGGGLPTTAAGCSCSCHWSTAETRAGLEAWEKARAAMERQAAAAAAASLTVLDDFVRAREALRTVLGIFRGEDVEDLRGKPWRIERRPLPNRGDVYECLDVRYAVDCDWAFQDSMELPVEAGAPASRYRNFERRSEGDLTIVRRHGSQRAVYAFTASMEVARG